MSNFEKLGIIQLHKEHVFNIEGGCQYVLCIADVVEP